MTNEIHQTPGRIRIRMPALKKNEEAARHVRRLVAGLPGVEDVRINAVTGSVIVRFDEERVLAADVIDALRHGGFMPNVIGFRKPMPRKIASAAPRPVSALALALSPSTLPLPSKAPLPALSPFAAKAVNQVAKLLIICVVERTVGKTAAKVVDAIL